MSISPDNNEPVNEPVNESLLNRPLYKDTSTCRDKSLKFGSFNNKDKFSNYKDYPGIPYIDSNYDFLSLRNILREEMDKPITIRQAKEVGDALIDVYHALYFEDL